MKNTRRIIISGGGTGGHIYPAVAIANELRGIDPSIEILFVGAEGKMEMEKVPKTGYKIVGLPIAGFNRTNILANAGFPFKLLKSLRIAKKVITDFAPDAVVGVGGYASGPTLFMAGRLGIPTLIQEQNSYAGITNKLLAKRAKKICVAYPDMEAFFPKEKITFTGNPVRNDIVEHSITKESAMAHFGLSPNRPTVLIIGGSQGARSINEAIEANLKELCKEAQVIWQTGKGFIEQAKQTAQHFPTDRVYVSDFIYDMAHAYAAADVVASRAGALSVSELCLVAKPSILVPFPHAAEDHQSKNAMSLVNKQAALLVADKNVASDLAKAILGLINDTEMKATLAKNIKLLARPNAGKQIAEEVLKIAEG